MAFSSNLPIQTILHQLTLQEKVALCSGKDYWSLKGVPRLGIASIQVSDGPHGLRKQKANPDGYAFRDNVPATCFPTAVTLASTWNLELVQAVGVALGEEARAEGVVVLLGPGANIKRSPLGGRNFEYFSEDPYLTGQLATAFIRGVQSTGVGASLKHFAANNQEYRRLSTDSLIDERALREIYLAGFEQAVKSGQPWTVMAAYNQLNGVYCCEHPDLLENILRQEWGFQGLVVSDWGAVNDRLAGLLAGMDLEMPGLNGFHDTGLLQAVQAGSLPLEVLDQSVERILTLICAASEVLSKPAVYDAAAHHALARQAAAEGAVLLKNERSLLPLSPAQNIAIIGAFAQHPRYQGAGSSIVTPSQVDTAYQALQQKFSDTTRLSYAPGYGLRSDTPDPALLAEAQRVAQAADVAVVFAGLPDTYETEGIDRQHMRLPDSHKALIEAVAAVNPNTVVILMNGAPVELPWHAQIPAILEAYLGGQAGGSAIAQLLYGEANPSGKLAETFPLCLEDHPTHTCFPGGPCTVEYRESIYVGYRYFDTTSQDVLFPFGHGLSYTTFEYRDLQLSAQQIQAGDTLTVQMTVTNTGERAGQEVVQLYVHKLDATVFRPQQELKAFAKVQLAPGEAETVTFSLDRRAFAYWETSLHDWHVEGGAYEIRVGASSHDIRLVAVIEVCAADAQLNSPQAHLAEYAHPAGWSGFSREAFAALYGKPLPENCPPRRGEFSLNTPLADMRGSRLAALLRAIIRWQNVATAGYESGGPTARMIQETLREMPLRMFRMVPGSPLSAPMLDGLLLLLNGHHRQGLKTLWRALFSGRKRSSTPMRSARAK